MDQMIACAKTSTYLKSVVGFDGTSNHDAELDRLALEKPVTGYAALFIDDAGLGQPRGTPGRLAVRGPTGCRYLADDRQTGYVNDGWNITGETFVMAVMGRRAGPSRRFARRIDPLFTEDHMSHQIIQPDGWAPAKGYANGMLTDDGTPHVVRYRQDRIPSATKRSRRCLPQSLGASFSSDDNGNCCRLGRRRCASGNRSNRRDQTKRLSKTTIASSKIQTSDSRADTRLELRFRPRLNRHHSNRKTAALDLGLAPQAFLHSPQKSQE